MGKKFDEIPEKGPLGQDNKKIVKALEENQKRYTESSNRRDLTWKEKQVDRIIKGVIK